MSESSVLGRIAWYQLVTKDATAANDFYTQVIGWNNEETNENGEEAASVWSETASSGALVTIDTNQQLPSHWRAYIAVPDLADACEKVMMGGGEIVQEPTEFNGIGEAALATDLLGAAFGMVQPSSTLPPFTHGNATPGHFCWSELNTENYTLAFRFYEALFQWKPGRAVNIPDGRVYQMFAQQSNEIGGIMGFRKGEDLPPHWQQYIHVDSVDSAATRATSLGGTLLVEPHQVPDGARAARISDPQGAIFNVWSPPNRSNG